MENALKVSKRIRRLRGKYLSVYGEYDKFRIVCSTHNRLQIIGKYLNVFGEYAERIYAYVHGEDAKRLLPYSPNTPRDKKLSISQLTMVRHEILSDPYFLYNMGWIKPKNYFTRYCPFKK
jgi:hypothetical protein